MITKSEVKLCLAFYIVIIILFITVDVPVGASIILTVAMGWFLLISGIEYYTRKRKDHYHMQKGERDA